MPKRKWTMPVAIVSALISAAAVITVALINKEKWDTDAVIPAGEILRPVDDENVGRSFQVSGELSGIPEGGHIWLAVEVNNTLWPKEPEISASDRRFSKQIIEGGSYPDGVFTLSLLLVSSEGQAAIEEWLENGRNTGEYPGLEDIPGSARLDVVDGLRLEE